MTRNASIFTRIFLASLIPFALVVIFSAVILTELIYRYNQQHHIDSASLFARHVSDKIRTSLDHVDALVQLTSKNMAVLADSGGQSEAAVQDLLHTLMGSNPEIHCAWYVFREGVLNDGPGWQARSYLMRDGAPFEIPAVRELEDPLRAPWHFYPFHSSAPYFDIIDYWDYGVGDGPVYTGTLAYPILRDGEVIGTVGIDILYEKTLRFIDGIDDEPGYNLILTGESGTIIHSRYGRLNGGNLLELPFEEPDRLRLGEALNTVASVTAELSSPVAGEVSLIQFRPVLAGEGDRHRLFLYLDMPVRLLNRNLQSLMRMMTLLCALGAIAVVVVTYYAARGIVKPIRRLTRLSEAIARDEEEIDPVELNKAGRGGTELGVLARSLRKMLEKTRQNHLLQLKALEDEYEKKKLEETGKARTEFFATMSHELRTPMNAIVGIAEILSSENMPESQKEYVRDIKSSSESLLAIIDDILDISRLDAGKLKLVPSTINLWRLLDNVASLTKYLARAKNLEFSLERDSGLPEYIFADEVRIRQILVNLLGNAIKYTKSGRVELKAKAEDGMLRFDVTDTGIGIRDEDRQTLFETFHQVDTTRNRNIKGTGLGLSICMNLAKLMGGGIEVESVYGRGSTFRIRVPLVPGDPASAAKGESEENDGIRPGARVLVVDDNEINLRVANGLMTMCGLQCDTASSGLDGLRLACTHPYDMIFMDHMMPEMDGAETTRRIRAMGGKLATVPVIAFTANSVTGVREVLLQSGMNDYLSKPIRKNALLQVLRRWLPATDSEPLRAG